MAGSGQEYATVLLREILKLGHQYTVTFGEYPSLAQMPLNLEKHFFCITLQGNNSKIN